jgi:peptidoglycan/LPS O-acetylase OafA/YrhL
VLFVAVLVGPIVSTFGLREYFGDQRLWTYFSNLVFYIRFYLPGVFEDTPLAGAVNGSLWTLPVEVGMYLGVVLVGAFSMTRLSFSVLWSVCSVLVVTLWVVERLAPFELVGGSVVYATSLGAALEIAPYFMLGGMFKILERQVRTSPPLALVLLATIFWLMVLWSRFFQFSYFPTG